MSRFWGIVRYEYRMSTKRWGMWLTFGLLALLYLYDCLFNYQPGALLPGDVWSFAGRSAFQMNVLMPVAAGILIADRLVRDTKLGVGELLQGAPLTRRVYILGKYTGALLSALTPALLLILLLALLVLISRGPLGVVPALLAAFMAIVAPAYAFITAFSLACPLVIPLRVYQVLFTGYWFWGNFLSPKVMPTLSETLLTASGRYMLDAFFGGMLGASGRAPFAVAEAWLNLVVLALCIVAALVAADGYLAWQARQA